MALPTGAALASTSQRRRGRKRPSRIATHRGRCEVVRAGLERSQRGPSEAENWTAPPHFELKPLAAALHLLLPSFEHTMIRPSARDARRCRQGLDEQRHLFERCTANENAFPGSAMER